MGTSLTLNQLVTDAHKNALKKGFWDTPQAFGESIALIHSELSEALEDYRSGSGVREMWYTYKDTGDMKHIAPFKTIENKDDLFSMIGVQSVVPEVEYGKPCGIPSELADAIIRICDLAGYYRIDLEEAVISKMVYNQTRPYKHGKIL